MKKLKSLSSVVNDIKWYECQKVFCHSFDTPDCDPATLLPQSSKYSKSADLLRKSLLSHIWRVPSSNALSCKHERLFDLLTLVSYNRKYEIDVQIDFLLKLSYFYCIIHHEKKISSGQGDRNPWKSKFPTGGIVRDPLWRLIWWNSKTDSKVWMREERAEYLDRLIFFCTCSLPRKRFRGFLCGDFNVTGYCSLRSQ